MSFFDSLTLFKKTNDGEVVYFPNGFLGKGFIVPDVVKEKQIKESLKHFYKIFFSLIMAISVCFGIAMGFSIMLPDVWRWIIVIICVIALLGVGFWAQWSQTKLTKNLLQGLQESTLKISLWENHLNSARSINFIALVFACVASWNLAGAGLQISKSSNVYHQVFGPFGIFLFLFCCLAFLASGYLILVKTYIGLSQTKSSK